MSTTRDLVLEALVTHATHDAEGQPLCPAGHPDHAVVSVDDDGRVSCVRASGARSCTQVQILTLLAPDLLGLGYTGAPQSRADGDDGSEADVRTAPADDAEMMRIVHAIPEDAERHDDIANARLFAHHHGNVLRWNVENKFWMTWTGLRWKADVGGGSAVRRAEETARSLWPIAYSETDETERAALLRRAGGAGQRARIEAMIALGRAFMETFAAEFDADPYLLNLANGTLDLRSGELLPHSSRDLLTRLAPVTWAENSTSERWDYFLRSSIEDPDEREFLQRLAGYCLLGLSTEEKFFFIHGPAASGKSTFVEALAATLGEYAGTADPALFLKSQRPTDANTANPALVHLVGRRLVVSSEPPKGRSWDEGFLKRLTGGDTISTRQNYGMTFEFKPQFTLLIVGNSRPPVDDNAGDSMSRRFLEIPFPNSVDGSRRDDTLKADLTDPDLSGSAILAWAVEGCLKWQQDGLRIPQTVRVATEKYWAEQASNDSVRTFIEDCYELTGNDADRVRFSDLHQHFIAIEGGHLTTRALASRIRDLGVSDVRSHGARWWTGLRVRSAVPPARRPILWDEALENVVALYPNDEAS